MSVWKEIKIGSSSFVQVNVDGLTHTVKQFEATDSQKWMMENLSMVRTQAILGSLILVNLVFLVLETDAMSLDKSVPTWIIAANRICLSIYVIELIARLYAYNMVFFKSLFNLVDLFVVASDMILEILSLTIGFRGPNLTFFRLLRIARLLRAYKVMKMCPLLAGMVHDLSGAFEAVVWGSIILVFFLAVWGILAVHFLQPVIDELVSESSVLDYCERCPQAFLTVWKANLTLFSTMVAGDAWGTIAIPVIEFRSWTCLFFWGAWFSTQMMIMNVILAAVVTRASETRSSDLQQVMLLKEQDFIAKSKQLLAICERLDSDGTGDLTLAELLEGWDTSAQFAATFNEMGIERDDLKTVFMIMDFDGSGSFDFKEFIHHIHKMKTQDIATVLNFIKHYVLEILRQTKQLTIDSAPMAKSVQPSPGDTTKYYATHSPDKVPNLFEEQQRLPPVVNGLSREVACNATELCSPLNAVLEQVKDDLTRRLETMASASDLHLKLLQTIDRSVNTMAASIDMNNSFRTGPDKLSQAGFGHESEANRALPATASPISGCCALQRSDRQLLVTRPFHEFPDSEGRHLHK